MEMRITVKRGQRALTGGKGFKLGIDGRLRHGDSTPLKIALVDALNRRNITADSAMDRIDI